VSAKPPCYELLIRRITISSVPMLAIAPSCFDEEFCAFSELLASEFRQPDLSAYLTQSVLSEFARHARSSRRRLSVRVSTG
jgi:hypothetical protein